MELGYFDCSSGAHPPKLCGHFPRNHLDPFIVKLLKFSCRREWRESGFSLTRTTFKFLLRKIYAAMVIVLVVLNAQAQIGDKSDKPGEVQKPLVPRELIPPSPALPVAE